MIESIKTRTSRSFWEKELANIAPVDDIFNIKTNNSEKRYETVSFMIDDSEANSTEKMFSNAYLQFIFYFSVFQVTLAGLTVAKNLIGHMASLAPGKSSIYPLALQIDRENTIKEILCMTNQKVKMAVNNNHSDLKKYLKKIDYLFIDKRVCKNSPDYYINSENECRVIVSLYPDNRRIDVIFRSDLIESKELERLFKTYAVVRKQSLENLDIRNDSIKLVDYCEENSFIYQDVDFRRKQEHITDVFSRIVKNYPDRRAVWCGGQSVTYAELDKQSDTIAAAFKRYDDQTIVPLYLERSCFMISALLGVLKAGKTYIPIDAETPERRVMNIIKDCGTKLLVTNHNVSEEFSENFNGGTILRTNDLFDGLYKDNGQVNQLRDFSVPIYMIYTSGTTGKPKGVVIKNHNLMNYIDWRIREYDYSEKDVTLQLISFGFDGFIANLFTSLLSGGTLVITDETTRNNYKVIADIVEKQNVTKMSVVPSMYKLLLSAATPSQIKSIEQVVLAAEAADQQLLEKSRRMNPYITLINEYGPSECTVGVTFNKELNKDNTDIVGKPIANTKAFILSKDMRLLPVGFKGELCFCGEGVSSGYYSQSNASVNFVPDFYKGMTLYKTGDLAMWTESGDIRLLGRADTQFKINGQRIELKEIENVIYEFEGVKNVVIKIRNNTEICVYIVKETETELSLAELTTYVKNTLPVYMIPKHYFFIDSIPLTVNGKIDMNSLPEPKQSEQEIAEPENDKQVFVLESMKKVLGKTNFGIRHNFFDEGGDSLKAIELCTILNERYIINPQDIYIGETAEKIAKAAIPKGDGFYESIKKKNDNAAKIENDIKAFELIKDKAALAEKFKDLDTDSRDDYSEVLLVGATGYLGCHILHKLICDTNYSITMIVRGQTEKEAFARIADNYRNYFNEELDNCADRINVICGEITVQYFGIGEERYIELSRKIDVIINSAANVKHFGKYEDFYDINVKASDLLMDFAVIGKKKDYNFISTLSIASGSIDGEITYYFDESKCDVGQKVDNDYIRTKFEAEKKVLIRRKSGLNANIFRVGNLTFDSTTGIFQKNIEENAFYLLFRALYGIDKIPMLNGKIWDFSYVDQTADAVVRMFDRKYLKNRTYHIRNCIISPYECLEMLFGDSREKVDMDSYIDYLADLKQNGSYAELINSIIIHGNVDKIGKDTVMYIDTKETDALLEVMGFKWKKVDKKMLTLMIDYCKRIGFII